MQSCKRELAGRAKKLGGGGSKVPVKSFIPRDEKACYTMASLVRLLIMLDLRSAFADGMQS
jgi:hypothetical protein